MWVSEDDQEIGLTKAEYDQLVIRNPQWMADVWVKLWKRFNTYTIQVFQCASSGLATRLNYIRGNP